MGWGDDADDTGPSLLAHLQQARALLPRRYRWHQAGMGAVALTLALCCGLLPLPYGTALACTVLLSLSHRALRFTVTRDNPVVMALWQDPAATWPRPAAGRPQDLEAFLVQLESTYDTPLCLAFVGCGYAALFGIDLWGLSP